MTQNVYKRKLTTQEPFIHVFGGWEITAWTRNAAGESRFGERRKTLGISNKGASRIQQQRLELI